MEEIEERINWIEEVLETQEFNRVYEKQTFMQKIAEKTRASKMPTRRGESKLSVFGGAFTTSDDVTQGQVLHSFYLSTKSKFQPC